MESQPQGIILKTFTDVEFFAWFLLADVQCVMQ